MGIITAERFNSIKARVKAEMKRRNGYGSMAAFAGTEYDFSVTPAKDGVILKEHGQNMVDLLRNINQNDGLEATDIIVQDLDKVEEVLSKYEQESMTGSSSSCGGACSGLCTTTCTGSCEGSCSGYCANSCNGDCYGSCSGCSGSCSGGCGSCDSTCKGTCSKQCASSCTITCSGGCLGNCRYTSTA